MKEIPEDGPPLFSKWVYWYTLVLGFLVVLIFFFRMFTKHFS